MPYSRVADRACSRPPKASSESLPFTMIFATGDRKRGDLAARLRTQVSTRVPAGKVTSVSRPELGRKSRRGFSA